MRTALNVAVTALLCVCVTAADGKRPARPEVEELLARVAELKPEADTGDWTAEADLAELLQASSDLFWKLRTFAVLNADL